MKIKKAFDICKKNKIISIFGNEKGEQWLSDGYAVYPIFGLPELNEDYICKLYDINDAQRDKIRFTISQTKPLIDVEDCSADETPAEMWDISIIYDGKVMLPISTAEGLMFIDRVYLYMTQMKPNLGLNTTISTEVSEKIIILKILKLSEISMTIPNC